MTKKSITLKWLVGWCNKNKHTLWAEKGSHKPFRTNVELIALHEILAAARTQAKKEMGK